ncbi:hypothetical protein Ahy_A02g005776 isoform B [Arachis hypogaea]|uniref:Uncharacterized protein n=1 Tax=Arachis hypogaea TaxID=3818 RepID=A0A445E7M1_ARAHY|nr:hypothetical protein Ahy_A02g005776 isoform B [Arachis hypogaea]
MAAKLGGRAYLSSFVDAVLNKLSSLDVNSTPEAKKLADQKLFRRLKASLRATRPVLDDAEQKQIRDQEVNKWLVDLQDALYMADDLLDELSTKAATATATPTPTQRDPGNSSSWSHYVDSILEDSDDDEMGVVTSMQDIVDKLESIVEEKDDLDLKQGSLPNSIDKLIHLHYLDLSYTSILTLPESLCKLYNLQTLKLSYCKKLEMLPSRMEDLVNLRHLDIRGSDSLKEMPRGMSKLKHLNFLSGYIVGKHEENGTRELGALDNLHGSLCISKLENVNNSREALEAKIGNKKHINALELKWLPKGDIVDVETARDILDKLQPHQNLKGLSIVGFRGEIFPDWLGLPCYSNLTELSLKDCKNCGQVPSLGQLPSLQHLEIRGLDVLERIGGEFYNNAESSHQGTPFRSLQTLEFFDMPRWREWHIPDEFDGFLKLKSLLIEDCPVLSGDLPAHLPALEELTIDRCEELACSLPRASKLHQLTVKDSVFFGNAAPHKILIKKTQLAKSILECLPHVQSQCLQRLEIQQCRSAISISGDCLPDSLQFLRIWDCSKLTFSEQLQHKSLTEVVVSKCNSLTLFPLAALPNLKTLYISDCPEMDCFGEEGLPPSLTTIAISNCQKVERWITSKGLQSEDLTYLSLQQWNEVKLFPREGCLPASLKYLHLSSFSNLETLDCKGLHQLTSLQKLTIKDCPKLGNITQQNLPASISKLYIWGQCPLRSKLEEMNDPRIQFDTCFS